MFCGCQRTSWEQLKEMLAVLLVVVIARIINKLYQLCVNKNCILLLFIIHSLDPSSQRLSVSSM